MSKFKKIKKEKSETLLNAENMHAKGKHNMYNSMASSIVGNLGNIRNENIKRSLEGYHNAEHRLEPVAIVNNVTYINDSKATSINASWFALESMTSSIIWIVGGIDKGNDYAMVLELVAKKVKGIVMLGENVSKIYDAFSTLIPSIKQAHSMEEAVKMASSMAQDGDAVLLSPACASFDMFENYEERGKAFKSDVLKMLETV